MAEILTVKSLCGVVVVVGWVPMHRLVTATVRFGCDNLSKIKSINKEGDLKDKSILKLKKI